VERLFIPKNVFETYAFKTNFARLEKRAEREGFEPSIQV
jgi:hypothetical protein